MRKILKVFPGVFLLLGMLSLSAEARLADMNDGTVYDTSTKLSWLKDANYANTSGYSSASDGQMTWAQAVAWAKSLNECGGFAGLTGWRLPETSQPYNGTCCEDWRYMGIESELGHLYYASLANDPNVPGPVNVGPFTNVRNYLYWSGTEYALNESAAWTFFSFFPEAGPQSAARNPQSTGDVPLNFDFLRTYSYRNSTYFSKGSSSYAWAVRPGVRSTLVDMGDGTVYDLSTQLSWLKNGSAIPRDLTYKEALLEIGKLNAGGGFAGFKDWRLPAAASYDPTCQMQSGVQNGEIDCTGSEMGHLYYVSLGNVPNSGSPVNIGPFKNLDSRYRTSAGDAQDSSGARTFDMSSGIQSPIPMSNDYPQGFMAVRLGARTISAKTRSYTVKRGPDGSVICEPVVATAALAELPRKEPPACELTSDKTVIELGESVELRLTTKGEITSASIGDESVAPSGGTITKTPVKATKFTATVVGPGGSSICSAPVSIKLVLNVQFPFDRPKPAGNKKFPHDDPETWFDKPEAADPKDALDPCKNRLNEPLEDNMTLLKKAVNFVKDNPGTDVRVTGHTDCMGPEDNPDKYNEELSDRRAHAVTGYLKRELGLEEIGWKGLGSKQLHPGCDQFKGKICDPRACVCRAKNRRVELIVSPR